MLIKIITLLPGLNYAASGPGADWINGLLKKYWKISDRQRETSVVLADSKWSGIGV